MGSTSALINRDSTSVAKMSSQASGANTATPAMLGERRCTANAPKPSQTAPCVTRSSRALEPASSAGISKVSKVTTTKAPNHNTWSDTSVW